MRPENQFPSDLSCCVFFFFNDTATTEISPLSLHDALPISGHPAVGAIGAPRPASRRASSSWLADRKSTRLNSSHANISYAVFCLKKKKQVARQRYHGV